MRKTDLASKATHKSAEPEFQPRGVTPKSLPFAVQSVSLEKPERGAKWRGKMTALNGLKGWQNRQQSSQQLELWAWRSGNRSGAADTNLIISHEGNSGIHQISNIEIEIRKESSS